MKLFFIGELRSNRVSDGSRWRQYSKAVPVEFQTVFQWLPALAGDGIKKVRRWSMARPANFLHALFPLYSFSLLSSLPRPPPSAIFVSTETETLNYETKSTPRRPGNPTGTGRWSGASAQFYGPQRRRRTASLENGELGETLAALVLKTGHLGIDAIMTRFVGHYSQ